LNLITNYRYFQTFEYILEINTCYRKLFDAFWIIHGNKRNGCEIEQKNNDILKIDTLDFGHIDNKMFIAVGNYTFGKKLPFGDFFILYFYHENLEHNIDIGAYTNLK